MSNLPASANTGALLFTDIKNAGTIHLETWGIENKPAMFLNWHSDLLTNPADFIDELLQGHFEKKAAYAWMRRFGFLLKNADDLFILVDRHNSLEYLVTAALEGCFHRLSAGKMMHYSAVDSDCIIDTPQTVLLTRQCAKRLWQRSWKNPNLTLGSPYLTDMIYHRIYLLAILADLDVDEILLGIRCAPSFTKDKIFSSCVEVLLGTFPFLANVIQIMLHENDTIEQTWKNLTQVIVSNIESSDTVLPENILL